MGAKQTTEFRRNRKQQLIHFCGDKCCVCGYSRTASALEFHHINPELKLFGIAANGTCHNIQADIDEARKCALLCANCHREVHDGLIDAKTLLATQKYDDEYAMELVKDVQSKYLRETRYCSECGAPITQYSSSGKCLSCSHKSTIKPDREILKQLVYTTSFEEIGRQYGVSGKAVQKWCVSYGLPSKRAEIKQYTSKEWLEL